MKAIPFQNHDLLSCIVLSLAMLCLSGCSVSLRSALQSSFPSSLPVTSGLKLIQYPALPSYFENIHASTSASSIYSGGVEKPELSEDGQYLGFFSFEHLSTDPTDTYYGSGFAYQRDLKSTTVLLTNKNAQGQSTIIGQHLQSNDGNYTVFEGDPSVMGLTAPGSGTFFSNFIFRRKLSSGDLALVSDSMSGNIPVSNYLIEKGVSQDGRYVAYREYSQNLIYRKDLTLNNLTLVTVAADGTTPYGTEPYYSGVSTMSSDGNRIAFLGYQNIFSGGGYTGTQIFVRDISNSTTTLVSITSSGVTAQPSNIKRVFLSRDGNRVVFDGLFNGLLASTGTAASIYFKDLNTGQLDLVAKNASGLLLNGTSNLKSISSDGRFVCFSTTATNSLISSISSGNEALVIKDLQTEDLVRVATNAAGTTVGEGTNNECSLSGNGRLVSFTSTDGSLVSPQGATGRYIYVKEIAR